MFGHVKHKDHSMSTLVHIKELSIQWLISWSLCRIVSDTQSDVCRVVSDVQGDMCRVVSDIQGDMYRVVSDIQSDMCRVVSGTLHSNIPPERLGH